MIPAPPSRIPDREADLVLMLPAPPSTNKLWRPVARGKMVQTDIYAAWIEEGGWEVQIQRGGDRMLGSYAMRVGIGTGHDIDNLKALPDLLQKQRTVVNDAGCEELSIQRDPRLAGRRWRVELWALEPAA